MTNQIYKLEKVIAKRRKADPSGSYVAKLFEKGRKKMAQKVAEEGAEVAIAAVSEGKKEIREESADLLFHLLVLLNDANIDFDDVIDELAKRDGMSGLEEKKKRK